MAIATSNIFSESILLLEWVIFCLLIVNWYFARKRNIKVHMRLIISLFTVETIFNLYMLSRILTFNSSQQQNSLMIIHGSLGFLAYLLILYTILFMTEKIPQSLVFFTKDNRIWLMRFTTLVWMFFTISGTIVYITIYL